MRTRMSVLVVATAALASVGAALALKAGYLLVTGRAPRSAGVAYVNRPGEDELSA